MKEALEKVMWKQREIFKDAGLLAQTVEGELQLLEAAKGKGRDSLGPSEGDHPHQHALAKSVETHWTFDL